MRIALVQQHATRDRRDNIRRGLEAVRRAASDGAECVCFAELAFEWFHPQMRPAGDVASFEYRGNRVRLESVQNAIDQAEAAAKVIAGDSDKSLRT